MKHLKTGLFAAAACFALAASAQSSEALSRIRIGGTGGMHFNKTSFSNLEKNVFPSTSPVINGTGGIFAEFELGRNGRFALRPEVMFTSRGTRINGINFAVNTITGESSVGSLDYNVRAKYTDLRLPFIVNIGSTDWVHPYVFVAPVVGFCRGGQIRMEDKMYELELDVTKANMASTYVAGDIGVGLKVPVYVGGTDLQFGIEASYELGFTDTYSSQEKKGQAYAYGLYAPYDIQGTRKYSGFEVAATFSVPLSIFSGNGTAHATRVEIPEPVQPEPKKKEKTSGTVIKQKPCYDLEEIISLIDRGQSVNGLTICAIDVINFEYGKSTLNSESRRYLDKIVSLMLRTELEIEVKGHTDNKGSDDFNMELSRKRALAVYNYLIVRGVSRSRLSYSYYGMSQPIADNSTDAGRSMNRRVEFEIK